MKYANEVVASGTTGVASMYVEKKKSLCKKID